MWFVIVTPVLDIREADEQKIENKPPGPRNTTAFPALAQGLSHAAQLVLPWTLRVWISSLARPFYVSDAVSSRCLNFTLCADDTCCVAWQCWLSLQKVKCQIQEDGKLYIRLLWTLKRLIQRYKDNTKTCLLFNSHVTNADANGLCIPSSLAFILICSSIGKYN